MKGCPWRGAVFSDPIYEQVTISRPRANRTGRLCHPRSAPPRGFHPTLPPRLHPLCRLVTPAAADPRPQLRNKPPEAQTRESVRVERHVLFATHALSSNYVRGDCSKPHAVYVDDLSIASARTSTLKDFKNEMSNRYRHDRHGWTPLHPGASGQVRRARRSHNLCQTPYIHWILDGFKMEDWKPAKYPLRASRSFDLEHHMRSRPIEPYLSIICSLMYSMLGPLPDIAYIIGLLP
jgi:hypothetical protein